MLILKNFFIRYTEPTEQVDTCTEHPQRKKWAQNKCGILKSDVFAPCHYEVPVDKYLKRCTYDACACDQGGDCECLCTALAAYEYACAMKGVPIKWRTPDLCRNYIFIYFILLYNVEYMNLLLILLIFIYITI